MDESQISAAMAEREMLMGELRMMEAAAERGEAERASRQEMVHDLERMAAEAHDSDGAGSAGAEGREGGGVGDGAAIAEIMEAMAERQRLMSELDAMSAEKARLEQHVSQKREMAAAGETARSVAEPQLPPRIVEAMEEHQRLMSEMSSMEAEHARVSARREAEEAATETQDAEVDEKRAAMAEAMMLMSELEELQRVQAAQGGASRGAVGGGRVEAVPEAEPAVEELQRDRADGQESNAVGGVGGLMAMLGQLQGAIGAVAPHRLGVEDLGGRGGGHSAARTFAEEEGGEEIVGGSGAMNSEMVAEMQSLMAELSSLAAEKEELTRQSRELAVAQGARRGGASSDDRIISGGGDGDELSPEQRVAMLAELAELQAEQQRIQANPSFPRTPLGAAAPPRSSTGGGSSGARRAPQTREGLQGEGATAGMVEELMRVEAESQAAMAEREMLTSELASLEAEQAQLAAKRGGGGDAMAERELDAPMQEHGLTRIENAAFAGGQLPPEIAQALATQQMLWGEMETMEAEREAWHRARAEEDAARAGGAGAPGATPAAGGYARATRAQKERDLAEAKRERATLVSFLYLPLHLTRILLTV
jgi:hypothetical protein